MKSPYLLDSVGVFQRNLQFKVRGTTSSASPHPQEKVKGRSKLFSTQKSEKSGGVRSGGAISSSAPKSVTWAQLRK